MLKLQPLPNLSPQSPQEEPTNTSQTLQPKKTSRWNQIETFLGSSTKLTSTLLGSVSQEQPGAATPFAPAPTPKKGVATLAWVQGPQTTGNKTSAVDQTNHLLLMSELLPLHNNRSPHQWLTSTLKLSPPLPSHQSLYVPLPAAVTLIDPFPKTKTMITTSSAQALFVIMSHMQCNFT